MSPTACHALYVLHYQRPLIDSYILTAPSRTAWPLDASASKSQIGVTSHACTVMGKANTSFNRIPDARRRKGSEHAYVV